MLNSTIACSLRLTAYGYWRAGREFTLVGGMRVALNSQSLFGTFGTTAKSTKIILVFYLEAWCQIHGPIE